MRNESFEGLILSGKLPSPAGIGMKILELTRSDDFSSEEMGMTIKADSALTGRILKLANSAAKARAQPATTVSEAIMRLGSRTVRDLALAFSLVSKSRKGTCPSFDFDRYWSKSLGRAVSARNLSLRTHAGVPEEAYICGLMAEIGRLSLAFVHPDEYAELFDTGLMHDVEELLALETERFGIHHVELAGCLMSEWGLPDTFADSMKNYSVDRQVGDEPAAITDLGDVLRAADALASVMVASASTPRKSWLRYGAALAQLRKALDVNEEELVRFCDSCVGEWVSWGEEMDIPTSKDVRFAKVLERIARLESDAEPDPGSAPAAQAPAAATPSEPRPEAPPRVRLLIVDDDRTQRRALLGLLRREGFRLETATNGREALELILTQAPDMVISDWEMPVLDGLELCRSLRKIEIGRRVFFLMLTERGTEEAIVRAFDAGVDDVIAKPFVPRLLLARIKGGERLVNLQRQVDEDKEVMRKQLGQLAMMTRRLRSASLTDPLTELPNRRYAMRRLESEWASATRTGKSLCLIMADIDHFKAVNDDHGHDVGDIVLKEVAQVMSASLGRCDEVCRLGGEEFLVICRNTSEEDGRLVAERIRAAVEKHVVDVPGFERSVTLSLGVAGIQPSTTGFEALLKAADEAVYEAKEAGRNRVRVAAQTERRKSA